MFHKSFPHFDNYFQLSFKLLKVVGFRLNTNECRKISKPLLILNDLYGIVSLITLLINIFMNVAYMSLSDAKIVLKLRAVPLIASSGLMVIKWLCFYLHSEKLVHILTGLREYYQPNKDGNRHYIFVNIFQIFITKSFIIFGIATDTFIFMILAHMNQQLIYLARDFQTVNSSAVLKTLIDRHCLCLE